MAARRRRPVEPVAPSPSPADEMPAHLAEFDPQEWGDTGPGTVAPGLGPTPQRCAAWWRWHRARGEWQVARGVPKRDIDVRDRYALLMIEWERDGYGRLSA